MRALATSRPVVSVSSTTAFNCASGVKRLTRPMASRRVRRVAHPVVDTTEDQSSGGGGARRSHGRAAQPVDQGDLDRFGADSSRNDASSNDGGPILLRGLLDAPYPSLGMPRKFLSMRPSGLVVVHRHGVGPGGRSRKTTSPRAQRGRWPPDAARTALVGSPGKPSSVRYNAIPSVPSASRAPTTRTVSVALPDPSAAAAVDATMRLLPIRGPALPLPLPSAAASVAALPFSRKEKSSWIFRGRRAQQVAVQLGHIAEHARCGHRRGTGSWSCAPPTAACRPGGAAQSSTAASRASSATTRLIS